MKILSSSLLALVLAAGPVWAQESQVFEFDYDQQGNATAVTLPGAAAPAQPAAPRTAVAPPARTPQGAAAAKDNTITLVGQPDPAGDAPPALSDDELFDLFAAPETEQTLVTPAGAPPVIAVPAAPGEAQVEKAQPQSRPAPAQAARPSNNAGASRAQTAVTAPAQQASAADQPSVATVTKSAPAALAVARVQRVTSQQQRWLLAHHNWSKAPRSQAKPVSLVPNRPLYPMDKPGAPIVRARSASVTPKILRRSAGTVVELTRFP
ncbi:MAG: hypothetical protein LBV79_03335 [Candidatus Adiutrix sp.]|jgi:hypothetical protein|nr:hypothetical protein [Candidatus Adiutrix sp.]